MKLIPILTLVLITITGAHSAVGAEKLSTEEVRTLQQRMKTATQLSVDFVQTKRNAIRPNKPSRSVGKAAFARPAKFRWEITKPVGEPLIYDGTNLYSLKASDKTATRYKAQGNRAQEIQEVIDIVLDFDAMLNRYTMSDPTKDGTKISMKLTPKTPGVLEFIDIQIDAASATVQGIKLNFNNKNSSEFEFSNPDRGVLPAKTFDVPKGYRVIDGL